MKNPICFLITALTVIIFLFESCSPKTNIAINETSITDDQETNPVASHSLDNPCRTFDQSENPDEAIEAHVLYRDFLRNQDFVSAFPYWKKAYKMAPAADGRRSSHYIDGVTLYENKIKQTTDSLVIKEYIDKIFQLYDEMEECYGGDGYIDGLRGFDLFYNYKGYAEDKEIFHYFKKSMDIDGDTANVFIINPMSDLLVRLYFSDQIDQMTAQKYAYQLLARIAKAEEEGKNIEQWSIVQEYAPSRLEIFEGVKGFYDCSYFRSRYYETLDELPADCDELRGIYGKLKRGGCSDTDTAFTLLKEAMIANCEQTAIYSEASLAYKALQNGDYEEAIDKFSAASESTADMEKKAKYQILIAKIYYGHLKNFPKAREWSLKAAKTKPNWGEPYLLIGRLYASSGPLCGPGRGWDSQIVTWPAIDKWEYAKKIDPSVSAEANKWINRYSQYMPTVEDGFQRGIENGASLKVGCWIQENTRVRLLKK